MPISKTITLYEFSELDQMAKVNAIIDIDGIGDDSVNILSRIEHAIEKDIKETLSFIDFKLYQLYPIAMSAIHHHDKASTDNFAKGSYTLKPYTSLEPIRDFISQDLYDLATKFLSSLTVTQSFNFDKYEMIVSPEYAKNIEECFAFIIDRIICDTIATHIVNSNTTIEQYSKDEDIMFFKNGNFFINFEE